MATFIILKPEALIQRIVGKIFTRFERKGFNLSNVLSTCPNKAVVEEHYAEHKGKDFYPRLCAQFINNEVMCAQVTHPLMNQEECVKAVRVLVGNLSTPGTIRGDFGQFSNVNMIHASDSVESAQREMKLWYTTVHLYDALDEGSDDERNDSEWVPPEARSGYH